ncbi:MAG: ribosome maturation factor RimP [Methylococcales bacterium]
MSDRLTSLIEPIVSGMGYELVGVEFVSHNLHPVLRVFIDSARGVVVSDCAKVSHQLSGTLAVEDPIPGNYQLEISSPGIERPLYKLADFDRFKGSAAVVHVHEEIDSRRKFRCVLRGVEARKVLLEIDGQILEIAFDRIKKAHLAPDIFGKKQEKQNGE